MCDVMWTVWAGTSVVLWFNFVGGAITKLYLHVVLCGDEIIGSSQVVWIILFRLKSIPKDKTNFGLSLQTVFLKKVSSHFVMLFYVFFYFIYSAFIKLGTRIECS